MSKQLHKSTTSTLLTNFKSSERSAYEEAIKEYKKIGGEINIYIEDKAYWSTGRLDSSINSLHTDGRGLGHDPFWDVYDEIVKLKKEQK